MTITAPTLAEHRAGLDEASFRSELRAFLAEHAASWSAKGLDAQRAWARTLADAGWAAPTWPVAFGGMGLPLRLLLPYHEELAVAGAPSHPSPNAFIVGPTILSHGTDEQRERFLRPIVRGDELWCQGFSEPEAGSDLPALRTRAERHGDRYLVHGQKLWTSKAMTADWMFAIVRTGTLEERQKGLTYLLIPLDAPGLTVQPLRDMTGGSWFAEVHLDGVEVPVAHRVGAEGDGWRMARTSLGHERSTSRVGMVIRYQRIVGDLIDLARAQGVAGDPVVRQRLARISTGARIAAMTFERVMASVLAGGEPGPASSVSRLFLARYEQELHELAVDLLGSRGMLEADALGGDGRWVWGFLNTRASTIGAGTAEIQRTTIGEQLLGLPREPR